MEAIAGGGQGWSDRVAVSVGVNRNRNGEREPDEGGVESAVVRDLSLLKSGQGRSNVQLRRAWSLRVIAKATLALDTARLTKFLQQLKRPTKDARKVMFKVNLKGSTIPHTVTGTSGASTVVLAPARPGTGVTAGKSVRPCLELAGITDILTKAYGSTSPKNLVKATLAALKQLKNRDQVEKIRGVSLVKSAGELVTA